MEGEDERDGRGREEIKGGIKETKERGRGCRTEREGLPTLRYM